MKLSGRIPAEYGILVAWTIIAILVVLFAPPGIYLTALLTFGAVVAASLLIAWAAEASETSISRALALAIVAIVQTIPEYFVEGSIAWKAGQQAIGLVQDPSTVWLANTIANFTGANRLLTGFGWPLILFTLIIQRKRKHSHAPPTISLRKEQSVEVVFMLAATIYYAWILIQGAITVVDSIILVIVFVGYMWILSSLPREKNTLEEPIEGAPLFLASIATRRKRFFALSSLFLFGAIAFYVLSGPFVDSIAGLANIFLFGLLGSGAVFFTIQWVAPVLSEFPEKISAFNWARQIKSAPVALLNFVSSSVNELTALVALIPIIVAISSRAVLLSIHLDSQQWVEIFLTMTQSIYACVILFDLKYDRTNAILLFTAWILSTAFINLRLYIGILFLFVSLVEIVRTWGKISVFSQFRDTLKTL